MIFAVCDKNNERCEYVHDKLNDYLNDHKIDVRIYSFFNSNILLSKLEDGDKFDYLVIDGDSVDLSEYSKWIGDDQTMIIICMVTSPECQKKHNIYYVDKKMNKPINEVDHIIEDTLKNRNYNESLGCYIVKKSTKLFRLSVLDMVYFEHIQANNIIHMRNGVTYTERKTITLAENELNKDLFIRCHRGYIVNIMYVKNIRSSHIVLADGNIIPVSKKLSSGVKDHFWRFYCNHEYSDNPIVRQMLRSNMH